MHLHQLPLSHYNEKVRWALDFKRVPHERTTYLPGPHMGPIKRLTGATQTPVLVIDGRALAGSAAILDALERRHPEPALLPPDPDERAQALAIQRRFDDEFGPAIRLAMFADILDDGAYFPLMFSLGKPWIVRAGYRLIFPLAKPTVRKANGITSAAAIEAARATTQVALDFVEETRAGRPYLVGETFSVADLTAASLLMPTADLHHPDVRRALPKGEGIRRWEARWAGHPTLAWVEGLYTRHRPGRA
ncbi:MAG: glutathione S-transferase family protein [Myxococcales bacterium]|nr:glutathione S-transferase family protein [Myxococcales bacterium]